MQNYKIMLVDDSPNILKSLKRALKDDNYTIFTCDSALRALQVLLDVSVDLIICDENMPDLSGTDLLRMVCIHNPSTIRIMITGLTDPNVVREAINRGEVYRFFNKPWDDMELITTVRQALQKKQIEPDDVLPKTTTTDLKEMLKKLERQHPGITEKKMSSSGKLVIDNSD
jgi:two-component system, probable response regulator PhcQ